MAPVVGLVTAAGAGGRAAFLDFLAEGEGADAAAGYKGSVNNWRESENEDEVKVEA